MPITNDRPWMAPTDITKLHEHIWQVLDARDAYYVAQSRSIEERKAYNNYFHARLALTAFIEKHYLEVFDLIYRGCANTDSISYHALEHRDNGSVKHAIPWFWNEEEGRVATAREVYHAPILKKEQDNDR